MHHYESEFPASSDGNGKVSSEFHDLRALQSMKAAGGDFSRIFKRMQDRERRATGYEGHRRSLKHNRGGESTPTLTRIGSAMQGAPGVTMYRYLNKSVSKITPSQAMNRDSTIASIQEASASFGGPTIKQTSGGGSFMTLKKSRKAMAVSHTKLVKDVLL